MCKQFAAMEEAAIKAYEEDLKRMERESQGRDLFINQLFGKKYRILTVLLSYFRVKLPGQSAHLTAAAVSDAAEESSAATSAQKAAKEEGKREQEAQRVDGAAAATGGTSGLGGGLHGGRTHVLLQHHNWRWDVLVYGIFVPFCVYLSFFLMFFAESRWEKPTDLPGETSASVPLEVPHIY